MLLKIINKKKKIFGIIISFIFILNFFTFLNPQQNTYKSFEETELTPAVTYTGSNIPVRVNNPENIQIVNHYTINFEKFTKENYKVKQVALILKNDFSILIDFQAFLTIQFSTHT